MKELDKIVGQRIFLETLNSNNFSDDYIKWMQDEDVLRFLSRRPKTCTRADLETYILRMNESTSDYLFGIFLKEENLHIGNIKIGNIDPERKKADIGLLIGNKNMWGKRYGTEAINLVVEFVFEQLNLNKLVAGMFIDNTASIKAFSKLGFKKILSSQKSSSSNGAAVEIILMEKVKQ